MIGETWPLDIVESQLCGLKVGVTFDLEIVLGVPQPLQIPKMRHFLLNWINFMNNKNKSPSYPILNHS